METPNRTPGRRVGVVVGTIVVVGVLSAGAFAVTRPGAGPWAASSSTAPTVATGPGSSGPPSVAPASTVAGAVAANPSVCGGGRGTEVMADGMLMAPVPHRVPTVAEQHAARALVASVRAGIERYARLSDAVAAGYVPATNPRGYVVHYANWDVVRAGDVLDANRPSSLVYANTVSGPVLLGAMFLGPAPCRPGPDVGGPLTQWHAHANLCLSPTHEVVGRTGASGTCTVGAHNTDTFFMMHVWTAPTLATDYQFAAHVPKEAYAAIIRSGRA